MIAFCEDKSSASKEFLMIQERHIVTKKYAFLQAFAQIAPSPFTNPWWFWVNIGHHWLVLGGTRSVSRAVLVGTW